MNLASIFSVYQISPGQLVAIIAVETLVVLGLWAYRRRRGKRIDL